MSRAGVAFAPGRRVTPQSGRVVAAGRNWFSHRGITGTPGPHAGPPPWFPLIQSVAKPRNAFPEAAMTDFSVRCSSLQADHGLRQFHRAESLFKPLIFLNDFDHAARNSA
jgi:hypothetical protein